MKAELEDFKADTSIRTSSIARHLQSCETTRMEPYGDSEGRQIFRAICDDGYWVGWWRSG